jgi:hypothetical protein
MVEVSLKQVTTYFDTYGSYYLSCTIQLDVRIPAVDNPVLNETNFWSFWILSRV